MEFTIKNAEEKDVDQLKPLMLQYIVDFYQRPKPDEKDLEELILSLMHNPSVGKQLLAVENDRLIGFSTLYFTFSTTRVKKVAILNDLFITQKWRGKGIGESLFRKSEQQAREMGCANMSWQTAVDNVKAQSLYRKMGGVDANEQWIHYELNL
ncbi:GNAT family N-acetyltransferase [Falsibacillus pallidus]|uniref:Acetyltransferase (GNAT) family protein n=1 Tax=Falsibacillus pallidus TaxID=493781 RepID=A0A370GXL8_9BACI|nr:GNAT family N-acetyltransferase [Falsibacillus pallidus]RDI48016.1 acetyltransferase (GNAT) family protein [Falsibacillus pallidus]